MGNIYPALSLPMSQTVLSNIKPWQKRLRCLKIAQNRSLETVFPSVKLFFFFFNQWKVKALALASLLTGDIKANVRKANSGAIQVSGAKCSAHDTPPSPHQCRPGLLWWSLLSAPHQQEGVQHQRITSRSSGSMGALTSSIEKQSCHWDLKAQASGKAWNMAVLLSVLMSSKVLFTLNCWGCQWPHHNVELSSAVEFLSNAGSQIRKEDLI